MSTKSKSEKKQVDCPMPKKDEIAKEKHFGDGVADTIIDETNRRTKDLIKILIASVFDLLEEETKELPEIIRKKLNDLRNRPETEKKIYNLWSEHLFERCLIPDRYRGLSDEELIDCFQQIGFFEGMYCGYYITVSSLAENGISKKDILNARKTILPRLDKRQYQERRELIKQISNEMRMWGNEDTKE